MAWGEAELEPEVLDWYRALPDREAGRVGEYVELLEERGPLLGEPHTRELEGKLRELRFSLRTGDWRITYYIVTGRRIILLTVFRKTRDRESAQIERAVQAMARCVAAGHTAEDET